MTLSGVLYGHGHMGRLHAEKLRARTDVHLAIIDPAAGFRETDPVPRLAIIATPTRSHAEVAAPLPPQVSLPHREAARPSAALAEVLAALPLAVATSSASIPSHGTAQVGNRRMSSDSGRPDRRPTST